MKKKKLLVVVDMQNDFVTGALKNSDAEKIINNVVKKVQSYEDTEDLVVFTQDTHFDYNYLDTQEGKHLPVKHCIIETDGWEIIDQLKSYLHGYNIIQKYTFGSIDVGEMIKFNASLDKFDQVELIGLCTDICVISNAMVIKAFYPNIPITVDAACCAGVTPESHDNALNAMKMIHIDVINQGEEPWRK